MLILFFAKLSFFTEEKQDDGFDPLSMHLVTRYHDTIYICTTVCASVPWLQKRLFDGKSMQGNGGKKHSIINSKIDKSCLFILKAFTVVFDCTRTLLILKAFTMVFDCTRIAEHFSFWRLLQWCLTVPEHCSKCYPSLSLGICKIRKYDKEKKEKRLVLNIWLTFPNISRLIPNILFWLRT